MSGKRPKCAKKLDKASDGVMERRWKIHILTYFITVIYLIIDNYSILKRRWVWKSKFICTFRNQMMSGGKKEVGMEAKIHMHEQSQPIIRKNVVMLDDVQTV